MRNKSFQGSRSSCCVCVDWPWFPTAGGFQSKWNVIHQSRLPPQLSVVENTTKQDGKKHVILHHHSQDFACLFRFPVCSKCSARESPSRLQECLTHIKKFLDVFRRSIQQKTLPVLTVQQQDESPTCTVKYLLMLFVEKKKERGTWEEIDFDVGLLNQKLFGGAVLELQVPPIFLPGKCVPGKKKWNLVPLWSVKGEGCVQRVIPPSAPGSGPLKGVSLCRHYRGNGKRGAQTWTSLSAA